MTQSSIFKLVINCNTPKPSILQQSFHLYTLKLPPSITLFWVFLKLSIFYWIPTENQQTYNQRCQKHRKPETSKASILGPQTCTRGQTVSWVWTKIKETEVYKRGLGKIRCEDYVRKVKSWVWDGDQKSATKEEEALLWFQVNDKVWWGNSKLLLA